MFGRDQHTGGRKPNRHQEKATTVCNNFATIIGLGMTNTSDPEQSDSSNAETSIVPASYTPHDCETLDTSSVVNQSTSTGAERLETNPFP